MKPFRELNAAQFDARRMRDAVEEHGHILVRNLLPVGDLAGLLDAILVVLSSAGWLARGCDPRQRISNSGAACQPGDPAFKAVSEQVFNLERLHALAHHPALQEAMSALTGPRPFVHPRPIPRLVFPNAHRFRALPHQDHHTIGGDLNTFTAWMPLHDCEPRHGPLQVLEDSHRFGLQKTPPDSGVVESAQGAEWAGGTICAGDVLFFHSLTVHTAQPNSSTQIRISMDCRFQDAGRPVHPSNLVSTGSAPHTWEETYEGWKSTELQYYWKRLPLEFRPTASELAQLAQTDPSPEMRARHARILARMIEQGLA